MFDLMVACQEVSMEDGALLRQSEALAAGAPAVAEPPSKLDGAPAVAAPAVAVADGSDFASRATAIG